LMLDRVAHAMTPVSSLKNRIMTLLNDKTTASGFTNSYSQVIFILLNQLNISTQGKSKIFLDVSTVQEIVAFNGKIQLWIYRIESEKIAAFLALNAIAEEIEIDLCCTRQIFLERLTTSLRVRQVYRFSQLHQNI